MAEKSAETLSPSKQAAKRVGTDLTEKWRIDRVLGVGGMGAVFAVTHKNNGTRAAIKVLHREYASAIDVRERFLREGRIANRVDHPARVAVVDDGISSLGEPYLVMDLLEGMTLAELFKRGGGRMPLDKLFGCFDTVLDLLAKCHEADIIHRDIKPANIFLTKDGGVKVLDFGVARMRETEANVEATRAGIALGTASFIAPEQALGMEKIDGRADLFSVGACLYTGVTGERLHAAKSEAEEFILSATQTAPSVARKAADLPLEVVAFIDKALAFNRAQRFQSAPEMRTELLKLTLGLRAGTLKAVRKAATGVVVKGNDVVEDGPDLTDAELRDQRERLQNILKQLGFAMASVRQYGLGHPQTQKALTQTFADIGTALAISEYSVRWDIDTAAFIFEGQPVWVPDRVPFDRIPHQLFADGIRKIQFKPGVTEEELRDFIAILLRDVSTLFGVEDDSVTALWDRRFEHVAYLAVDSFAEGDNLDPDRVVDWNRIADQAAKLARIDKDFDDGSLEGQALEHAVLGRLQAAGEAAASLALDPITKGTLGAQLAPPQERWLESYLDIFVPAYLDSAHRGDLDLVNQSLRAWVEDQRALQSVERVFEMHEHMSAAFRAQLIPHEAGRVEALLGEFLFPLDAIRSLMTDIAMERRGAWGGDAVVNLPPKELVTALGRALDLIASDAVFLLACECLDSAKSASLREVLVPYIRRWSPGQEAQMTTMVARAGVELGKFIIEIFVELGTPLATQGIEAALANTNLEVKLAALGAMGEGLGDRAKDEIASLLESLEAPIRMKTLELVTTFNVIAAGPFLVRRVQAESFHEVTVDERRKWLQTICTIRPTRGEAVCIEMLSKRRIITTDSTEQSRAVAAEALAIFDSKEAHLALSQAAKQRWATTAVVRDAALKSMQIIESRRVEGQARP